IVISMIASIGQKQAHAEHGYLQVNKLNDRVRNLRHSMENTLLPANAVKKQHKQEAKEEEQAAKAQAAALKSTKGGKDPEQATAPDEEAAPGRVFVLNFEGDVRASRLDQLRLEVSAILTMAGAADEVVVVLESPGGMVHSYGLAASQLMRIRDKGIPLTAVVDKVAASGGYLMAAVANKVLAAPFALVGSIGVVAQIPNVHRLLKKNDVDVEILTAGKYKRTLTTLGENTDEGRQKFVEELEDVHALFQEFVADNRPQLDIAAVATGEAWYGKRALDLQLVDALSTSDEYLMQACEDREVFSVKWVEQRKPIDRLLGKVNGLLDQAAQLLEMWRR
ncbi:MAG: protease SohB, partial [Pseudomonadota bacterium]